MNIKTITTDFFDSNIYLFETNGKKFMIDCGGSNTFHLIDKPDVILLTHGHIDHIFSLSSFYDCDIFIHKNDLPFLHDPNLNLSSLLINTPFTFNGKCKNYSKLPKEYNIQVIHTPGHTPGSVSLLIDGSLFTGDTLFCGGIGNTSFPLGNEADEKASLQKLFSLPLTTNVFPGHGEATTIEREKYLY